MEEKEIRAIIEDQVNNSINKYFKSTVRKLNLYTILQVAWLIEIYYLGANGIYELLSSDNKFVKQLNIPNIVLPKEVELYNNIIKEYFSSWSSFIFFFAIAMIICGMFFSFIRLIPNLSDYRLIYLYSVYGAVLGDWLILIYCTYLAYLHMGIFFILIPIGVSAVIKIKEKLKEKLRI
ncbi:hypothetical protein [Clostridium sp.]|uniref:hypothetical protein n=1 Tax=Clostridium sp. TaxID=1506 RepID=UPI0025C21ADD|nr:hypothetical protein [Clostridium sp.]